MWGIVKICVARGAVPVLWPSAAIAWCGKAVEVELVTTDRYPRTVAFVIVGDTVVNEELLRQGLATVFTR
jgi:endonuclease YncB( thermonuclease family)